MFRGIVLSEGQRLCTLNETEESFKASIQKLQEKCTKSDFNTKMLNETIKDVEKMNHQDIERKKAQGKRRKNDRITWPTQFKNILRLNKTEKKLAPKATMTYCRPPTIGHYITNYKSIAIEEKTSIEHGSHPCGRCGLCGNHGSLRNMVLKTQDIQLKNGKKITIKDAVTCKDKGIYAAKCTQCQAYYVGQTITSFSTRWNTHRLNWRKMIKNKEKTEINMENESERWKEHNALYLHYATNHKEKLLTTTLLSDAYKLIFVERHRPKHLDRRENNWIGNRYITSFYRNYVFVMFMRCFRET